MRVLNWNLLSVLSLITATFLILDSQATNIENGTIGVKFPLDSIFTYALRGTCDNEERYQNQMMCKGQPLGGKVPYPDDCNLYLVCDCLFPTVMKCPASLWWNNISQTCDFPQNTVCVYYTFSTISPTDETTVPTPPTADVPTESTLPSTLSTIASTEPTTKPTTVPTPPTADISTETTAPTTVFTTASTDHTIMSTTRDSTINDEEGPTTKFDAPPAPPGIDETFCEHFKDGSIHRYPYNCNAYINCTHGWPILNYCDDDKMFNEHLLICDTPDMVDCEELPLPTSTTPGTTTTANENEECGEPPEGIDKDFCTPLGNGFYEYPYNCSGYLVCHNGCTDLDYCIPDKLFNSIWHICDTPNSVICDPKPFPTPVPTLSTQKETNTTAAYTSTTTETTPVTLPPDVDPDQCEGLPDNTRLPYAENCSQFIQCQDHKVIMGQCPGDLLFNPDFLICDDADDVWCYGDRTTVAVTSSTTNGEWSTTSSATEPNPDNVCTGQEAGKSYPYEPDCGKYIFCTGNGEYFIADCPYNSWYDPYDEICSPLASPTACREWTTTTSTPKPTEPVTFDPELACSDQEPGKSYPYYPDCTKYILCTGNGSFAIVDCIFNSWYDPYNEMCSPLTSPTACKDYDPNGQTTTTTIVTDTPQLGICDGKDEGQLIPYPDRCSKYIVCVSPIPIAFYCNEDLFFNAEQQQCVSWEDSDCEKTTSTAIIATTPEDSTRPPPKPTMCTNSSRDSFPYPDNCQWYIRCINDYDYMMEVCNCGEYYDPVMGKCGPDVSPDACREDYSTTTAWPTTPVTRPPPQIDPCEDVEEGRLVPYPYDCTKYIKCDRPIATAYDCAEGDEFSEEFQQCMEASLANCTITTTPGTGGTSTDASSSSSTDSFTTSETESSTTESQESSSETPTGSDVTTPTTAMTTVQPPDGICADKPIGAFVPYPYNCSKYIICEYPIPIGYDCPDGLEFSPTELECMDPDLANCSPNTTTTLESKPTSEPSSSSNAETSDITTTTSPHTDTTPETTKNPSSSTETDTTESTDAPTDSTTELTDNPVSTTEPTSTLTPEITSTTPPSPSTTDTSESTESTSEWTDSPDTPSTTETSTTMDTSESTESTSEWTDSPDTPSTTETSTTMDPYTPNICCGQKLGSLLPYPHDSNRYVVCDWPIPIAVDCDDGLVYDETAQKCLSTKDTSFFQIEF